MSTAVNYLSEVRQQYEEFPYPERNPADEIKQFWSTYLSRLDAVNHFCHRGKEDFNNFRVLIAGGGTGDNAISWAEQLQGKENCEVVYLDMSTASTNIAKKRAAVRMLNDIRWVNDSILNVPNLDLGQFDHIDCAGVLHHLADPDAGLKALVSVLKPDGAMSLMVYAPYGRAGIYVIQNLMRLVNGTEQNPRQKIKNSKAILASLPIYHAYHVAKQLKILTFNDDTNDAGIYDMFLHAQDRAYTILEVHDWLERCGLRMAGEPGNCYMQEEYLPETHIKDKNLLKVIKGYPLKVQQAIGEAMANRIAKHEFYAVHAAAGDTVARVTERNLVVCKGMSNQISFADLAAMAVKHRDSFTITFSNAQTGSQSKIYVPKGTFVQQLLRQIDGNRTVGEIIDAIKNSEGYNPRDEALLYKDLEELFLSLNRGYAAFLRHKAVAPFTSLQEIQDRLIRKIGRRQ
jgi:ubiquinone/menaquinone biosynthesis C-methylase UbiE